MGLSSIETVYSMSITVDILYIDKSEVLAD